MDRGRISFNPHQEKNRISLLLVESPDFFSWGSRFSFIRGWQVCLKMARLGFGLNIQQNELV